MDKLLGKMDVDKYYKWRFKVEELQHTKTQEALMIKREANMGLEMEIAKLKYHIFKDQVRASSIKAKLIEKEFKEFIVELEEDLGYSLDNIIINPETLEVMEMSTQK